MKKLIFVFLIICLPLFAQDRVKVASTANPSQNKLSNITTDTATENNLTIPGTLSVTGNIAGTGADNLLNNQTLTGAGSIITRSIGDARYVTNIGSASGILPIANGGTGTNTTQLTGNWTNTGNFTVNGNLTVASNFTGFGSAFSITSGTFQANIVTTNPLSSVNIDLSNPSVTSGGGGVISFIGSTNARATGTFPLDLLIRSDSGGRIVFSGGTAVHAYFDMAAATKTFVILPSARMIVSNTFQATGATTLNSTLNVSNAAVFAGTVTISNTTYSSTLTTTNLLVSGKPANWKQTFFPANMADGSFYDANPTSRFVMGSTPPYMASLVYTNNQSIVAPHYPLPASQLAGRQLIIRTIIAVNTADTGDIVVVQGIASSTNIAQNAGWNVGNNQLNAATTITKTMPATAFGAIQFVSTNLLATNAVAASAYAYPNRQAGGDTYTSNVFLISTEVEEIQQ